MERKDHWEHLGPSFSLQEAARETHPTPSGGTQEFWYSRSARVA